MVDRPFGATTNGTPSQMMKSSSIAPIPHGIKIAGGPSFAFFAEGWDSTNLSLRILSQIGNADPYLPRQQRHSRRHQARRNPPPLIHPLVQKDFRGDGVCDKGEGSGGGSDQAYVSPGERE